MPLTLFTRDVITVLMTTKIFLDLNSLVNSLECLGNVLAQARQTVSHLQLHLLEAWDAGKMTSLKDGVVHNAVRRMTELIDLESLEGYFDEYLVETTSTRGQEEDDFDKDDFDTLPGKKECFSAEKAKPPSAQRITIESYTKICIERPNDNLNDKQQNLPKSKCEENKKPRREKKESLDIADDKRKQRDSRSFRVSDLEKNAWRDYGRNGKRDHYSRQNRSKISWILKFFCGVNQEFKWYSLKGKGLCLILPMVICYVVLCVVLLPFLFVVAAVSALGLGAGLCSYFSLATKKVGVASDDESDKSCLEDILWWA